MVCTRCGAEANASCNCGVDYKPKAVRAREAVEANPEKSDRAIAADIGVSAPTVGKARKESTVNNLTVDERIGLDGKTRKQHSNAPRARRINHRAMKLGEHVLEQLKGTSLERAAEQDALIALNRGAGLGTLKPEVQQLIDDAVAGKMVSALAVGTNENFEVEYPEQIKKNLLDTIDQSSAVVRAYKKILKVSSLEQGAKDEVSAAIGKLIIKWQSLRASLAPHPADNGEAPIAGSDHPIPDDLSIPGFLNRTPTESTRG